MNVTKEQLVDLLDRFNRQRPGLEFGNYGDATSYRSELRSIARDKREADALLCAVAQRDSITAADLLAAFSAFSGRLRVIEDSKGNPVLDYCTGQYWPTEYRKAVAAVCASALWHRMTDDFHESRHTYDGAGDYARKTALRQFGRGIAQRWFR